MSKDKAQQKLNSDAKEMFEAMDKDDDGTVLIGEFRKWCNENGKKGVAELFSQYDSSDDKKVTLDEIEDMLAKEDFLKLTQCHVTQLFHELDTSNDGKLNKAEFKELLAVGADFPDDVMDAIMSRYGGEDGLISLQEFLDGMNENMS